MRKFSPYILVVLITFIAAFNTSKAQQNFFTGTITFYNFCNTPVPADTISEIRNSLKLAEQSGRETDILFYKICLAYASWFNCTGHDDELIRWCQRKIDNLQDNRPEYLDVYLTLAEYYLFTEQSFILTDKCLNRAEMILSEYYSQKDYHHGIFNFLKGYLHMRKYDERVALHYFIQSQDQIGDVPFLEKYRYLNRLGIMHALNDLRYETQEVISYATESILWCKQSGQPAAPFYYFCGMTYYSIDDTAQALIYMQQAVSIKPAGITALTNYYVTHAWFMLHHLTPSRPPQYLFKALKMSEAIAHNERSRLYINLGIARYYYHRNQYKQSLPYLQKAIIAGSYGFTDTSVFSNPALHDIRPYYHNAAVYTLKASTMAKYTEAGTKSQQATIESIDLATQFIEKFVVDVNEENSGLSLTEDLKRSLNNQVIYDIWLYQYRGDSVLKAKAFAAAEQSKSLVLRVKTSMLLKMARGGVPDSLIQKYEYLNNAIIEEENKKSIDFKADIRYYNSKLTLLYNKRDRLELFINEQFPRYRVTKYENQLASVPAVQKYLDEDQVLVEYQLTLRQLIIFILTGSEFIVTTASVDERCPAEIEKLRNVLTENPAADEPNAFHEFISSSSWLHDLLIKPVTDTVSQRRIIIVPNGMLTTIPFEVLISAKPPEGSLPDYRNLPYLVRDYAVSYAYSCTFLLEQLPEHSRQRKNMAIFIPGYEQNDPEFTALAGADKEGLNIRNLSSGHLYRGKKANERNFKEKASGFNILHIASHALMDEKDPNRSCLVMTRDKKDEDGYLYAYEIRQMNLNARLVVLSGCNTGNGRLQLSEGLISLARCFFYTGVRTVAVTLWPVSDQAASWLIQHFYLGLSRNETLDIAMQNAKTAYIRNADPVKAHPHYWANYVVVGKTNSIPLQTRHFRWKYILAVTAGVLVIFGITLAYRKNR